MRRPLIVAAGLVFAAPGAFASCTWEWMCNGEGSCKQMPVCDSVYEVPPPKPAEPAPVPPPMSLRPRHPLHAMRGLECEEVMRRSASGHWSWDQACYCADSRKARDPTTPFANIVRCEAPWKESRPAPRTPDVEAPRGVWEPPEEGARGAPT
ncbi:MAG TPA: hypothetical protein VLS49_13980 [Usitatibacter sp.]|nr:hypothetical protein [Usitatibacter sp.]